jgi:hypothetical protein
MKPSSFSGLTPRLRKPVESSSPSRAAKQDEPVPFSITFFLEGQGIRVSKNFLSGGTLGMGLSVAVDEPVQVVEVHEGMAAALEGVEPGWTITHIAGRSVAYLACDDIRGLIIQAAQGDLSDLAQEEVQPLRGRSPSPASPASRVLRSMSPTSCLSGDRGKVHWHKYFALHFRTPAGAAKLINFRTGDQLGLELSEDIPPKVLSVSGLSKTRGVAEGWLLTQVAETNVENLPFSDTFAWLKQVQQGQGRNNGA